MKISDIVEMIEKEKRRGKQIRKEKGSYFYDQINKNFIKIV